MVGSVVWLCILLGLQWKTLCQNCNRRIFENKMKSKLKFKKMKKVTVGSFKMSGNTFAFCNKVPMPGQWWDVEHCSLWNCQIVHVVRWTHFHLIYCCNEKAGVLFSPSYCSIESLSIVPGVKEVKNMEFETTRSLLDFKDILLDRYGTSDFMWMSQKWQHHVAYLHTSKTNPQKIKHDVLASSRVQHVIAEVKGSCLNS